MLKSRVKPIFWLEKKSYLASREGYKNVNNSIKDVTEIIVHAVTKPLERTSVLEEEIRKRVSDMNVRIERLRSFSDHHGNFESSRVTTSPVNLEHIRGRRLGLKNCEIQFFEPPLQ